MKKILPLMGLLAAFATTPAWAHGAMGGEHFLHEADTNHDGYVDKDEYDTYMNNEFDEMDTDNDGKISKDEIMAHHKGKMETHHKKRSHKHSSSDTGENSDMDKSDTNEDTKTNNQ